MSETVTSYQGRGLGRLLHHDERNRRFVTRFAGAKLRSRNHRRYGKPFDQGHLGSCTGNALAGLLNTSPLHVPRKLYTEQDAVAFYSAGTALDPFEGRYPPDDTGCDGQSVAEAARQAGLITRYEHAFGIDQALATISHVPVMTGVPWYTGMFETDLDGFVAVSGGIAGGHEFEVSGINVEEEYVWCWQSWGAWGVRGTGRFKLRFADWDRLLREDGDVTAVYRDPA